MENKKQNTEHYANGYLNELRKLAAPRDEDFISNAKLEAKKLIEVNVESTLFSNCTDEEFEEILKY